MRPEQANSRVHLLVQVPVRALVPRRPSLEPVVPMPLGTCRPAQESPAGWRGSNSTREFLSMGSVVMRRRRLPKGACGHSVQMIREDEARRYRLAIPGEHARSEERKFQNGRAWNPPGAKFAPDPPAWSAPDPSCVWRIPEPTFVTSANQGVLFLYLLLLALLGGNASAIDFACHPPSVVFWSTWRKSNRTF